MFLRNKGSGGLPGGFEVRESFLDCGGNPDSNRDTPLWRGRRPGLICLRSVRAKAPSPLRSAGAVQDAGATAAQWQN